MSVSRSACPTHTQTLFWARIKVALNCLGAPFADRMETVGEAKQRQRQQLRLASGQKWAPHAARPTRFFFFFFLAPPKTISGQP